MQDVIEVVHHKPVRFPAARKLLEVGVPPRTVDRWIRVRREFTRELPARVRRDVN